MEKSKRTEGDLEMARQVYSMVVERNLDLNPINESTRASFPFMFVYGKLGDLIMLRVFH